MLYTPSDSFSSNCQIPVLIQRCNSGATFAVISTHITIILESLPKPGDDTLEVSKFLGYFPSWVRPYSSRPIILPRKNHPVCHNYVAIALKGF
ncbi:hypothetical protein TNCV_2511821 [Trichonephila clavipes]|nr:hypothetical protein TNCV_2511821 [Trichonephila clavipes]